MSPKNRLRRVADRFLKRPVKEAVHEALAEGRLTVVADEPGAEAWPESDGDESTDYTETDTDEESASSSDGDSRRRRRRGLAGLAVLLPLAAVAAAVQYRRGRGDPAETDESSGEAVEENGDQTARVSAGSGSRLAPGGDDADAVSATSTGE